MSWKRILKAEDIEWLSTKIINGEREMWSERHQIACPSETWILDENSKNRNEAIQNDKIKYGPINLSDNDYWIELADHWKTTPEVAKKSKCSNCVAFDISPRMKDCMPLEGDLGYCWMHKFKCHKDRTCYTWVQGGPIRENSVSIKNQKRGSK